VSPPEPFGDNAAPVSLVIATYNRGAKITRTLDSVARQSLPPAEVLVVDDGSTDGTGEWVRSHYPRVRVVRRANGGTSAARNTGAEAAAQPVLMFLDHDDELLPQAVETLVRLLDVFPEAHAAFADHTYRNTVTGVYFANHHELQPAFHRLHAVRVQRREGSSRLYGYELHRALLSGNLLQQPWAVRRETFHAIGGFDPGIRYCEDWDLFLRLTHIVSVAQSDEVISHHLVDGENLHLSDAQEPMHVRVLDKQLAGRWREPGVLALIRRRRARYYKKWGDLAQTAVEARRWYRRALADWPADYVVLARLAGLDPAWSRRAGDDVSATASGPIAKGS
jgi:glycosyltransferase involved in cell wall biosynthesis